MDGMKPDTIAAIQVAIFLFGTAWLDGAFDVPEPPKVVPQFDKPNVTAHIDHHHQEPVDLTVPPPASIPLSMRTYQARPRVEDEALYYHPSMGKSGADLTVFRYAAAAAANAALAARRMPVVYEAPRINHPDHGPDLADAPILSGDLHGAIPAPGPGISPSARHQFQNPSRDTSAHA